MKPSRSRITLLPTPVGSDGLLEEPPALRRPKVVEPKSRSEPFLPLPSTSKSVSRRQSKGGLRELFLKNKSTKTISTTSELEETVTGTTIHTNTTSTGSHNAAWIPPPLFQAYPQSVKHVTLDASTLAPQTIIRLNEQQSALTPSAHISSNNVADNPLTGRPPRRASAVIAQAGWTRKVFVLTTLGHLLQYAGEGPFDRKPEKVLHLDKDSKAFASDAIEGRHFVLHVSQCCNDDGEQDFASSKGLFSRIRLKSAGVRRTAKLFLMVFDAAEEFDSWLSAIRRMIRTLGGRPYSPRMGISLSDAAPPSAVTQRYLIQKNPLQFSYAPPPIESTDTATDDRPSTRSSVYTVTDLERLRDSKTSNISAVTGTPTSVIDSPPSSPFQGKFSPGEAPYLELPDLGPSSLIDFSQHEKRQSRLSVMIADMRGCKSVDVLPTEKIPPLATADTQQAVRMSSVVESKQTSPKPKIAAQETGSQPVRKQQQEHSDDGDAEKSERPISILTPLPTLFSFRDAAPELSVTHKYTRQPCSAASAASQIPKRFSSLDYSRVHRQSYTHMSPSTQTLPPSNTLWRPRSIQMQTDVAPVQVPARAPSLRTFDRDRASWLITPGSAGTESTVSLNQCPKEERTPFGPPLGPPPSCPLPAVPADALPLRRQSLASRDATTSGCWGDEPLEIF